MIHSAVQSELRKTNLVKDKLEDLCRSLQKESREVGDESRRRNEEELRQRQALQAKFTQAINVSQRRVRDSGVKGRLSKNEKP